MRVAGKLPPRRGGEGVLGRLPGTVLGTVPSRPTTPAGQFRPSQTGSVIAQPTRMSASVPRDAERPSEPLRTATSRRSPGAPRSTRRGSTTEVTRATAARCSHRWTTYLRQLGSAFRTRRAGGVLTDANRMTPHEDADWRRLLCSSPPSVARALLRMFETRWTTVMRATRGPLVW